jgi:hypothetical protein
MVVQHPLEELAGKFFFLSVPTTMKTLSHRWHMSQEISNTPPGDYSITPPSY